jgi:hypothetical protein
MKRYVSRTTAVLSLFCGLLAFPLACIFWEVRHALMFSIMFLLMFTAALLIATPIALSFSDRKYRGIEEVVEERIDRKHIHGYKDSWQYRIIVLLDNDETFSLVSPNVSRLARHLTLIQ